MSNKQGGRFTSTGICYSGVKADGRPLQWTSGLRGRLTMWSPWRRTLQGEEGVSLIRWVCMVPCPFVLWPLASAALWSGTRRCSCGLWLLQACSGGTRKLHSAVQQCEVALSAADSEVRQGARRGSASALRSSSDQMRDIGRWRSSSYRLYGRLGALF